MPITPSSGRVADLNQTLPQQDNLNNSTHSPIQLRNGRVWNSLFNGSTALKIGALAATAIIIGIGGILLARGRQSGLLNGNEMGKDATESGTFELNVNDNAMETFPPDSLCTVSSRYKDPYGNIFPSGSDIIEQKDVKDYIEEIRNIYQGKAYQYNITVKCKGQPNENGPSHFFEAEQNKAPPQLLNQSSSETCRLEKIFIKFSKSAFEQQNPNPSTPLMIAPPSSFMLQNRSSPMVEQTASKITTTLVTETSEELEIPRQPEPSHESSHESSWVYEAGSTLPDGREVLQGHFDKDLNGEGKIEWSVVFTYGGDRHAPITQRETAEGTFKNGKLEGQGKYITGNGGVPRARTYEGLFKNSKLNGEGTLTSTSCYGESVVSKGIFEYGQLIKGERRASDNYFYRGTFKNNMLHGENCICKDYDGEREGSFEDGKLLKGVYKHRDGTIEEGEFKYEILTKGTTTKPNFIWNWLKTHLMQKEKIL